jgi:putative ABC transport system substrate-binding protein
MRRRDLLVFTGIGFSLASTGLAGAQGAIRTKRIGVLMARPEDDSEGQKQFAALRDGLAELGWRHDQSILIDTRWRAGDPAKFLEAAYELVGLMPDVLVANGTPSLVAMRKVVGALPVVFVAVADPLGQGFVPSLARPGGNITGFSVEEASMGGKWLEVLKEAAPQVANISIIYNPDTAPYAPMFFPAMQAAASAKRASLAIVPVRSAPDIERIIDSTARQPNGGLIVLPDSFMFGERRRIIALTAERRLPVCYPIRFFVSDGGLIAYGIDRVDLFRRAASYVDRILRGTAVPDLPVQQPTRFELAVNNRTAKALGLTLPQSLLLSADEVIE